MTTRQKELDIIEKWYPSNLTEAEKKMRSEYKSLHEYQLFVAIKRMWKNSKIFGKEVK